MTDEVNVVVNGSFSSYSGNTPTGWTPFTAGTGSVSITTAVYDVLYGAAVKLECPVGAGNIAGIYQMVDLTDVAWIRVFVHSTYNTYSSTTIYVYIDNDLVYTYKRPYYTYYDCYPVSHFAPVDLTKYSGIHRVSFVSDGSQATYPSRTTIDEVEILSHQRIAGGNPFYTYDEDNSRHYVSGFTISTTTYCNCEVLSNDTTGLISHYSTCDWNKSGSVTRTQNNVNFYGVQYITFNYCCTAGVTHDFYIDGTLVHSMNGYNGSSKFTTPYSFAVPDLYKNSQDTHEFKIITTHSNHGIARIERLSALSGAVAGFSNSPIVYVNTDIGIVNTSAGAFAYLWDFGDGNTSNLESPDKEYKFPGVYNISLIVNEGRSDTDSTSGVVTIKSAPTRIYVRRGTGELVASDSLAYRQMCWDNTNKILKIGTTDDQEWDDALQINKKTVFIKRDDGSVTEVDV